MTVRMRILALVVRGMPLVCAAVAGVCDVRAFGATGDGKPMRGVMSPVVPQEKDFRDLRSWGANLMRYQITAPTDGTYDATLDGKLDHLEKNLIPWGRTYGIRLIVDLHTPPGGREKGGEVRLYHDEALAARFVDFWRKTAVRFKGNHDVIYGYDLLNEPVQNRAAAPGCDYWTVQKRAAEAIRESDRETSVIVAPKCWGLSEGFRHLPALDVDNVIYTVHVYEPHDFTHQGVQKQWPRGVAWPGKDAKGVWRDIRWLDEKLRPVRAFAYNHKAKILVGEFSAIGWGEGAERYISDCIALFEAYGWDWTYHAFREWSGWSVEHAYMPGAKPSGMVPSKGNPRMKALRDGFAGRIDPAFVTWSRDFAAMGGLVDAGWSNCMAKCWSPKTSLVYGCAPEKVRPAKAFDDGPGYFRWQKGVKGKSHYGEGMGDCALICGTALSGLVDRWNATKDPATAEMARKVAQGVLNLAVLHGYKGFVARGICAEDGRSVCSLSSRDQYTHWLHGLYRYATSGMADEAFVRAFAAEAVNVARYMERLCTPERNWNFGMVDGSPDPRGICTMWGPDLSPHEQARLPMIYGIAWKLSGDVHWKDAYEALVDEALDKSQGMSDEKEVLRMPCYSLLQAMCSFELIRAIETGPARRAKLERAMAATATAAARRAEIELLNPRRTFYGMCDDGELSLTMGMWPATTERGFRDDFLARTVARAPLGVAGTCRNAHVFAAYWRTRSARGRLQGCAAGAASKPSRPLEDIVDAAFAGHWKYGFSEKTSLLHGCPTNAVKPLSEFKDGIFDWYKGIPGGYGRGMGDCALNHGVALSGCVDRWAVLSKRGRSPDSPEMRQTAEWAAKLAQGLLNLTSRHPYRGFVARGLCWEDGKSICSLSSIDQHTHWIHGLWRYAHSPMARREIVDEYRRRVVEVAERMERTVTPERDYNFGLCDGRPDPRGICKMWWGGEPKPGCCRLASIYAAAFDATGDEHWREAYERIADVACAGAATITDAKATDPSWIYRCPTYCLLQNNSACETLLGIERDPKRRELLITSMRKAAAEADWRTKEKLKNPKREWYGMCAPGEMALAQLMTPGWNFDATARDVLDGAIRNRKGWPTFAVTHFFAAYWRLAARQETKSGDDYR